MLIAGIDEAGRGPIIGPMIITGYLIEENKLTQLKKLGVKDSKEIISEKRTKIAIELKKIAKEIISIEVNPKEIDKFTKKHLLNHLELQKIGLIISKFKEKPDKIFIDSPEKNFKNKLKMFFDIKSELIVEHKADANYLVVGAASIIAKTTRDNVIKEIEKKFPEIGSGYPADEKTRRFLEKLLKEKKELPEFIRKSWSTLQEIKLKTELKGKQQKLFTK